MCTLSEKTSVETIAALPVPNTGTNDEVLYLMIMFKTLTHCNKELQVSPVKYFWASGSGLSLSMNQNFDKVNILVNRKMTLNDIGMMVKVIKN